jgi:hypothetical protein
VEWGMEEAGEGFKWRARAGRGQRLPSDAETMDG